MEVPDPDGARRQFRDPLRRYDLGTWTFTREVIVEPSAIRADAEHSHQR